MNAPQRPFDSLESYKAVIVHGMIQAQCPEHRVHELIKKYAAEVEALYKAGCAAITLITWLSLEYRARG